MADSAVCVGLGKRSAAIRGNQRLSRTTLADRRERAIAKVEPELPSAVRELEFLFRFRCYWCYRGFMTMRSVRTSPAPGISSIREQKAGDSGSTGHRYERTPVGMPNAQCSAAVYGYNSTASQLVRI